MKCCVDCGRITRRTRCPNCQQQANKQRNDARRVGGHTDPEWIALSRRITCLHRTRNRGAWRKQQQQAYYARRDLMGLEAEPAGRC